MLVKSLFSKVDTILFFNLFNSLREASLMKLAKKFSFSWQNYFLNFGYGFFLVDWLVFLLEF